MMISVSQEHSGKQWCEHGRSKLLDTRHSLVVQEGYLLKVAVTLENIRYFTDMFHVLKITIIK
jgi:hypothetical protein